MQLPHVDCFCLPLGLSNQNVHACFNGCLLGASVGPSACVSAETIPPSSGPPTSILCPSSGLTTSTVTPCSTAYVIFLRFSSNLCHTQKEKKTVHKIPKKNSRARAHKEQDDALGTTRRSISSTTLKTHRPLYFLICGRKLAKGTGSPTLKTTKP
jgi:hypothetical protein